jgi:hypothetical protein
MCHLSCSLENLSVHNVTLVDSVSPTGLSFVSVQFEGRHIGSIRDDGFRAYSGQWIEDWVAFAGGSMVPTTYRDREGVLRELVSYCNRFAFSWRLALHG